MASPALAGLIIKFFYTGSSALGNLFPEVFAHEAPTTAICLAATAVSTSFMLSECSPDILQLQAAIDKYSVTGIQQDHQFEYTTYSKVFMQLMAMQAKIDTNPKHATLTRKLRFSWATTGRWVLSFSLNITSHSLYSASFDGGSAAADEDEFEVALD